MDDRAARAVTDARARRRAFAMLVALGVANHTVMSGARVAASLDALARGASPATVGALIALFALLPAVFSIPIRNMHTPVEIVSTKDIDRAAKIIAAFIATLDDEFVDKLAFEEEDGD